MSSMLFEDPSAYQRSAVFYYQIAEQLLNRLDWVTPVPRCIMDVGCGTGHYSSYLKKRYPESVLFGLDLSFPMLTFAKARQPEVFWICGDTEEMPIRSQSVDLITANLTLPWCQDMKKAMQEWRRILRPEGLLIFTSLGPDTLRELEFSVIRPQLADMHHFGDFLVQAGFIEPVMDVDYFTLKYKTQEKMIDELAVTGMIEPDCDVPDVLSMTYEIVFGTAWVPQTSGRNEAGVVKIPVDQILK